MKFPRCSLRCFAITLLLIGMVFFVGAPFYFNPPSYVAARRNLGIIYARAVGMSDHGVIEHPVGQQVLLWDLPAYCPQCNRPLIWFTHPRDGSKIMISERNSTQQQRFFVACEQSHSNRKRWFLFTDGTRELLNDSDVDWDSQVRKTR